MAESENERIVRTILERGFNQGDLSVFDEYVAEDCREHQGHAPGMPAVGPAAPKAVVQALRSAFPDLTLTVEDMVADGDKVWFRLRSSGTNEGSFMGNPPTHRHIEIDVIDICRFADSKMVDHWGVADRLGVMFQLGLGPKPAPVGA